MILPNIANLGNRNLRISKRLRRILATIGLASVVVDSSAPVVGVPIVRDTIPTYQVTDTSINTNPYQEELYEDIRESSYEAIEYEIPSYHNICIYDYGNEIEESSNRKLHYEIPIEEVDYERLVEALANQDYNYIYTTFINHEIGFRHSRGGEVIYENRLYRVHD